MKGWIVLLCLVHFALTDDVEVSSINLKGWEGCSSDQKAKISSGWDGAIKMASALKDKININEAAAVDYLGPPVYSSKYIDKVKKIFENTATFGQGSKWTPTPFKWDAYVRCDDWKRACSKNFAAAAYANNRMSNPNGRIPKSDDDHDGSTVIINFCSRYFTYPSLKDKIAEWKDEQNYIKYNLDWYRENRDYVVLHELMHADVITYKKNGNQAILDYRFSIKEDKQWRKAYGAANVKLFARIGEVFDGGYVTRNADSFAQYALAKSLQKALGDKYPYLPFALKGTLDDNERWKPKPAPGAMQIGDGDKLMWTSDAGKLIFSEDFQINANSCPTQGDTDSSVDGACGDLIQFSKVLNDSVYPEDYIKQRDAWYEEIATAKTQDLPSEPTGLSPVPENPSQLCNYDPIYDLPILPVDNNFAKDKIKAACGLFKGISLSADKQKDIIMPYESDGQEMYAWAAWNSGDPKCIQQGSGKIEEHHCVDMFNAIVSGCTNDADTITYGGSKVDSCIVYGFDTNRKFKLEPTTKR